MSSEVKRYDAVHLRYEDNNIRYGEGCEVEVVTARDYDALEAEFERLRAQVSALQSDANSWQSGYDKGREDGAKAAEGWKAQHARDSAELRRLCSERDALHAEAEALRGLTPELPPRPPEGAGLPRYGLRWNGPAQPLSVPMDDGYWTPWHLAEALRAENAALRAKQGERQEAVVYAVHAKGAQVDHHCPLVSPDMAADYLPGCATPLYTSPQPGPDVRSLVSADDVRDACANAVSVFAEETNADQCREVAEYMREVLLAQIAKQQAKGKGGKHE